MQPCYLALTKLFLEPSPLNIKRQSTYDCPRVALIAQVGEYCTGDTKNVGLNPVQSLKFILGY